MKSFSQWTIEEVEEQFQLTQVQNSPQLQDWMSSVEETSPTEEQVLMDLRQRFELRAWDWNEEELKVQFIGPLLFQVNFEEKLYRPFLEREISVSINNEKLSGVVDYMIAKGKRSPKKPYFFIHEYKKEHDTSNDPFGQLMIAMVVAQILNQDNNPIYGCYIMGRFWHFVVLQGKEYAVSSGHNATKEEIKEIFGILRKAKTLIQQLASSTPL